MLHINSHVESSAILEAYFWTIKPLGSSHLINSRFLKQSSLIDGQTTCNLLTVCGSRATVSHVSSMAAHHRDVKARSEIQVEFWRLFCDLISTNDLCQDSPEVETHEVHK